MSLILTTEHLLVINLSVEQLKKTCSFCRNVTDFEHLYSEHVYKTKQIKNTSVEASYEEFFSLCSSACLYFLFTFLLHLTL